MPIIKLPPQFRADHKTDIANLHTALTSLNLTIDAKALAEKKIDTTTTEAIKEVQKKFDLPPNGTLDEKTLSAVNISVHDNHVTANKYRTANLHSLFEKLKIDISPEEKNKRVARSDTRKAIEKFQTEEGLPADGRLSEDVLEKMHNRIIKDKFYAAPKNQRGILHTTLQK
ncbi:MAG: peptidoglycan-binding protein, partial [Chitinophagaceae bacterium]